MRYDAITVAIKIGDDRLLVRLCWYAVIFRDDRGVHFQVIRLYPISPIVASPADQVAEWCVRNVDEILFIRVILNFQVGIILKTYPGILAVGVGPKSLNLILTGIDGKNKSAYPL